MVFRIARRRQYPGRLLCHKPGTHVRPGSYTMPPDLPSATANIMFERLDLNSGPVRINLMLRFSFAEIIHLSARHSAGEHGGLCVSRALRHMTRAVGQGGQ